MVEEARTAAGITWAPCGKIFMDWDGLWEPITQTKELAYWEPTRTDSKAKHKVRTRGKGKGQTYIAFLYYACQALGVWITAENLFKVDIRNGDLEDLENIKIIDNLNNGMDPNTQPMLDNEKLELKEYTKEAI